MYLIHIIELSVSVILTIGHPSNISVKPYRSNAICAKLMKIWSLGDPTKDGIMIATMDFARQWTILDAWAMQIASWPRTSVTILASMSLDWSEPKQFALCLNRRVCYIAPIPQPNGIMTICTRSASLFTIVDVVATTIDSTLWKNVRKLVPTLFRLK